MGRNGSLTPFESGHTVVRSFEPGEDWFWDFATEQYYDGPPLADPQSHPATQHAPGPLGRVPVHWQQQLHG